MLPATQVDPAKPLYVGVSGTQAHLVVMVDEEGEASVGRLAEELRADVEQLCPESGRMPGSPGHKAARRFLVERVRDLQLEAYAGRYEHAYTVRRVAGTNIVAALPGRDRDRPPLLLGAHFDSVIAAPCADDNAAAVAILLALARQIKTLDLPRDVIFAFFDREEPPNFLSQTMGSMRFYAEQMDARGVHAAVIMDLVGHDIPIDSLLPIKIPIPGLSGLKDLVFMTGAESHPALEGCVRGVAVPGGLRLVATSNDNVGDLSDHAVFRWNCQPYLFFSCGHWEHYHQPTDTPDRLNYLKMARITAMLEDLACRLASADLPRKATGGAPVLDRRRAATDCEQADTTAYEIETLKGAFGILVPILMRLAGVKRLETRGDLQRVVAMLRQMGI